MKSTRCLLAFCILFSPSLLFCQVPFCTKENLPKIAKNIGPFVDTVNQKIYCCQSPVAMKWDSIELANYLSFEACGQNLILTKANGGIEVLYMGNYCYLFPEDSIFCGDSVLTIFSNYGIRMLSIKRNVGLGAREGFRGKNFVLQYLGGQEGYCVSSFYDAILGESVPDIHAWGVLDRNTGQWLIEPKFDIPFQFKNGVAWVRYYGKERKINEKGEFVE